MKQSSRSSHNCTFSAIVLAVDMIPPVEHTASQLGISHLKRKATSSHVGQLCYMLQLKYMDRPLIDVSVTTDALHCATQQYGSASDTTKGSYYQIYFTEFYKSEPAAGRTYGGAVMGVCLSWICKKYCSYVPWLLMQGYNRHIEPGICTNNYVLRGGVNRHFHTRFRTSHRLQKSRHIVNF